MLFIPLCGKCVRLIEAHRPADGAARREGRGDRDVRRTGRGDDSWLRKPAVPTRCTTEMRAFEVPMNEIDFDIAFAP